MTYGARVTSLRSARDGRESIFFAIRIKGAVPLPGASHDIGGKGPARKFGSPDSRLFHSALPAHRGKTGALRGSSSPICSILAQISSRYSPKGYGLPSHYNAPSKNPQPSESCPPPAGDPRPKAPSRKGRAGRTWGIASRQRPRQEKTQPQTAAGPAASGSFHPPGMLPLWEMSALLRAGWRAGKLRSRKGKKARRHLPPGCCFWKTPVSIFGRRRRPFPGYGRRCRRWGSSPRSPAEAKCALPSGRGA